MSSTSPTACVLKILQKENIGFNREGMQFLFSIVPKVCLCNIAIFCVYSVSLWSCDMCGFLLLGEHESFGGNHARDFSKVWFLKLREHRKGIYQQEWQETSSGNASNASGRAIATVQSMHSHVRL